jgi:hypothetical protein
MFSAEEDFDFVSLSSLLPKMFLNGVTDYSISWTDLESYRS